MTSNEKYHTFSQRLMAGIVDTIVFSPTIFLNNYFQANASNATFLCWTIFYVLLYSAYSIIGHAKYGQTIGKWVMNIKVLDIHEQQTIGYKQAFYRDSFWMIANFILVGYFATQMGQSGSYDRTFRNNVFEDYMSLISLFWFVLELATMMLNNKRRAIHDFMAGSVVVDLRQIRKEEVRLRHESLLESVR